MDLCTIWIPHFWALFNPILFPVVMTFNLLHGLRLPPHLRHEGQEPTPECYSLYHHCTPPAYSTNNKSNAAHINLLRKPHSTSSGISTGGVKASVNKHNWYQK